MSVPSTYQSASLYVGDLNPDVTEATLFEVFNAVGPVASIRVCRDAVTRRSLGYAYVNFHNALDAERALDTMNFHDIRGRACRIMWSQRDPSLRKSGQGNIFVKNLDTSIDSKSLYDTFSIFGNILSCKVSTNEKGESLGYGFVQFENQESAKKAIENVNNMMIQQKQVSVELFKPRNERITAERMKVNVQNLPANITEDKFKELLSAHGKVTTVRLHHTNDRHTGSAYFETAEQAQAAMAALNNFDVDGSKISVGPAHNFTNIYLKHLPAGLTVEKFNDLLRPFGNITSSRLFTDKEGRIFGFCNFESHDQAQAAINALNEQDFEGSKLYATVAEKKVDRLKRLNEQHQKKYSDIQKQLSVGNLYVKNFDETFDENALRQEFSKYGNITSCAIPKDENGRSKCFGFVCFSSAEEANKALVEMSRKLVNGKPLYVSVFQSKAQRRALFENRAAAMQRFPPMGFPPGAPMFYPGPQPRPNFMYPQQMMPRFPRPVMGMGRPGWFPMQVDPNQRPVLQGAFPRGRGGMRGVGRGGRGGNVKYVPNARNQPQAAAAAPAVAAPAAAAAPAPLTLDTLSSQKAEVQKQIIGERLYPLIANKQPELAGKLTGMLLEMDNGELLHLLESPESLDEKINEGLQVLREHQMLQAGPSTNLD